MTYSAKNDFQQIVEAKSSVLAGVDYEVGLVAELVKRIARLKAEDGGHDDGLYEGISEADFPLPALPYHQLLLEKGYALAERLVIAVALAWEFKPEVFDPFLLLNPLVNSPYTEFGGRILGSNRSFAPTFETVFYILSGHDLEKKMHFQRSIHPRCKLFVDKVLSFSEQQDQISWKESIIRPSEEFLSLLSGDKFNPSYSTSFPAQLISTNMDEQDMVLDSDTDERVNEIHTWLRHGQQVLQHYEFGKKATPGYKALFYGPSGTGKTLTAKILGKVHSLDVYRIDLSMLTSKWIGETEKNIKNIFDIAENKNWILFFDEADAIFGKRSLTRQSNDRYANQEIAYLLQRTEEYPGLVILATNLKANIDQAFHRRLNNMIYFPTPNEEMRKMLWQKMIPSDFVMDKIITLAELGKIDLTGGEILNVVHYCLLKAYERQDNRITETDMTYAITKELLKKGKAQR